VLPCSQRCSYLPGQPCQCDQQCHDQDDCCPDKVYYCGP
jgi:hypothetical protein